MPKLRSRSSRIKVDATLNSLFEKKTTCISNAKTEKGCQYLNTMLFVPRMDFAPNMSHLIKVDINQSQMIAKKTAKNFRTSIV